MSESQRQPQGRGERRRARLARARLYLVCDARPGDRGAEQVLAAALEGGVDVVQLREKVAGDGEIVRAARAFRRLCDEYDALFIVNDRPELAIECDADGVHLGQDDAGPAAARALVGGDTLIGRSTHSRAQIDAAAGVDYIAVGPVHATPTKPDYRPVGLELVAYAARNARVPFFAIGGIDPGNVAEVAAAGARSIAVVRAIRDAAEPREAARLLRAGLQAPAQAGVRG